METNLTPIAVEMPDFFRRVLQRKAGTGKPKKPADSFLKIIEKSSKLVQNE